MDRLTCKGCGCKLWSDWSKTLGACPECADPEAEEWNDLEERLENIPKESVDKPKELP